LGVYGVTPVPTPAIPLSCVTLSITQTPLLVLLDTLTVHAMSTIHVTSVQRYQHAVTVTQGRAGSPSPIAQKSLASAKITSHALPATMTLRVGGVPEHLIAPLSPLSVQPSAVVRYFLFFYLKFIYFVFLFFSDDHCFQELSCMDCTAERGCGWCPMTETCHSIDSPICGSSLETQCHKHCDKIQDCNLCIDMGLPCEWCAATRSCVDIGFVSNCSTTDSCASEICPELSTCATCLNTAGCGWCEMGHYCTDIFSPKCNLSRNCSGYFATGFSLGSFFGGMATMLALYLAIGICAYFYKKKNPPVHYQELQ